MAVLGPYQFSKGFSSGYSFNVVPEGFATDMKNCRFKNGSIVPRWSQVKTTASALGGGTNYVLGLNSWIDAANSVTALVAISNAKIYTADASSYFPNSSALTFTDRTGGTTIASSNVLRYTFDSLNGILIVAGNSAAGGVPLKVTAYNANAANLGGSPPKGDCVKVVNNIAFLGRQLNSANTYSTLNWSNVVDPETWTATNAIDVNKKDGEQIMALGAIGSDLYIFKQSTIWRLSTITTTVAGIATLGPLQLVIKGIGCCGPLALDNLPNGNIVFVGFDGHIYQFDGSSVIDISKQPYPGPNAYDSDSNFIICGTSIGVAGTQTVVKTWKGIGEVWIGYDSTPSLGVGNNLFNVFAYDYVNSVWQGYISDTYPKCFTTIPISSYMSSIFESNDMLFHGNATGDIFVRGNNTKTYPVDESNVAVDARFGTTLTLGKQANDFVPKSVCFETNATTSNLSALTVYATFDSRFSGGTSIAAPAGPLPARLVFSIPMKQDSVGTNVLPHILNMEWIATFNGSPSGECLRFGKFYISDEIIR